MNTPAHVILSAVALGRGRFEPHWGPITLGALVPDLPMFAFYAWQRLVLSTPEAVIWSDRYFETSWQLFFDLFNSLPLALLGALVAWRLHRPAALAFFASVALHALTDLPLHHEDAHRHFLPFSDWRFLSPVSYWDPARYGPWFLAVELLGIVAGSALLLRRGGAWRRVGALTLGCTAAFLAFAVAVWGPLASA